jgi:pilus assembly protein FimV
VPSTTPPPTARLAAISLTGSASAIAAAAHSNPPPPRAPKAPSSASPSLAFSVAPHDTTLSIALPARDDLEAIDTRTLGMEIDASLEILSGGVAHAEAPQVPFEEVFEAFKQGVSKQVAPTDFETHFNLGIAYKEMGLLEDAIGQFELTLPSSAHAIAARTMIGLCHLEQGETQRALQMLVAALDSPQLTPAQALALRFELGHAYECADEPVNALRFFKNVQDIDPQYRDVGERIRKLESSLETSTTSQPQ